MFFSMVGFALLIMRKIQFITNLQQKMLSEQICLQMSFLKFILIFIRSMKVQIFGLLKIWVVKFFSMFYTFYLS